MLNATNMPDEKEPHFSGQIIKHKKIRNILFYNVLRILGANIGLCYFTNPIADTKLE